MMVAFRYDNDAVGSLYYSREIPSLFRGLRLSKLYGRKGIITFESNGLFVLARGNGVPRLVFPGFRDIRGYQAMYRDFHAAIVEGRAPEMSLERAIDDQRLMDDVYSSLRRRPDADRTLRHHHHRQRRRGRHDGVRAGRHPGAHPHPRTRRLRPAGRRKLEPRGGLETSSLSNQRALDRRAWRRVPPVHALQRRRQHEVLGQRAVSPAA